MHIIVRAITWLLMPLQRMLLSPLCVVQLFIILASCAQWIGGRDTMTEGLSSLGKWLGVAAHDALHDRDGSSNHRTVTSWPRVVDVFQEHMEGLEVKWRTGWRQLEAITPMRLRALLRKADKSAGGSSSGIVVDPSRRHVAASTTTPSVATIEAISIPPIMTMSLGSESPFVFQKIVALTDTLRLMMNIDGGIANLFTNGLSVMMYGESLHLVSTEEVDNGLCQKFVFALAMCSSSGDAIGRRELICSTLSEWLGAPPIIHFGELVHCTRGQFEAIAALHGIQVVRLSLSVSETAAQAGVVSCAIVVGMGDSILHLVEDLTTLLVLREVPPHAVAATALPALVGSSCLLHRG
jgi:hypothetical protein